MIGLLLLGCPKDRYVPPTLTPIPDDVPTPRADGPIAGPRAVVDQAPPQPVPEGTPGGGPVPPWLAQVRAAVTAGLDRCLATGPATIKSGTALVTLRIDRAGNVLEVVFVRSSGSEAYDACLVEAARAARPEPPPPEALQADGQALTEMAFR